MLIVILDMWRPYGSCYSGLVFSPRALLLLLAIVAGCEGQISGGLGRPPLPGATGGGLGANPTGPAEVPNPCTEALSVGSAPIRRLSHLEYGYSLTDALDPSLTAVVRAQQGTLLADSVSLGFNNSATFLQVSNVLATNYMDAAEQLSISAVADLTKLLPCEARTAAAEAGCARQFIGSFGAKLYRRPLSAEETSAYVGVYHQARAGGYDFKSGIQWLVFTFLQSPGFLYRVEVDQTNDPAIRKLTGQELAVRLSFLIWQSGPDAALTQAVAAGDLSTKEDLAREATRMLADPKAERSFDFFSQWLGVETLDSFERDATAFPSLSPGLAGLLRAEVQQFISHVLSDDAKLSTLLTAPHTYVNGELAAHYGLTGVTGSTWQKATWPGRRGGVLMLGGVLTQKDKSNRTSIVRRGLIMRTQVMCQLVSAPPPGIPSLEEVTGSVSQAQRLAQHRTDAACSGCHTLLDPLGMPFENIDAVGRPRTIDESGHPSLTVGALAGLSEENLEGPVIDGLDLVSRYAQSSDIRGCFATQLYRFASGRKEEKGDACSRYQLNQRFAASGGNIKDLIVGLTQTDDFSNRRVATP